MKKIQPVKLLLLTAAACTLLVPAACSPKVDNGGYVQEKPIKDLITVGQSSKDDVKTKLGSPSAQSSFGAEAWYYVTQRKEAHAFFKPEITEQDVVRVEFNESGVVTKVENYSQKDGEDFDITKRTTPTEGHTLGFMEQVLGNIGRFNHPGNENTPGRRGSTPR